MGCDEIFPVIPKETIRFQSTHPRGVRRYLTCGYRPGERFNPRTRVGCDISQPVLAGLVIVGFNPRTRVGCDVIAGISQNYDTLFQSTHPRGVRPSGPETSAFTLSMFQSTHPRGVRPACAVWFCSSPDFQSTHPRGVRPHSLMRASAVDRFQSTHPRGVRPDGPLGGRDGIQGFNPRTRVGCDCKMGYVLPVGLVVSIHAPAWGATSRTWCFDRLRPLFQSTHPRGVRLSGMFFPVPGIPCFNPRTRVGCDSMNRISCPRVRLCFNPRTRVGCDTRIIHHLFEVRKFQSTHPRGVRHFLLPPDACKAKSFNPRTRVGCDWRCPAWGSWGASFNPRTRVGCDAGCARCRPCRGGFNPRTRVGCDITGTDGELRESKFQSTHPRGVRPCSE